MSDFPQYIMDIFWEIVGEKGKMQKLQRKLCCKILSKMFMNQNGKFSAMYHVKWTVERAQGNDSVLLLRLVRFDNLGAA